MELIIYIRSRECRHLLHSKVIKICQKMFIHLQLIKTLIHNAGRQQLKPFGLRLTFENKYQQWPVQDNLQNNIIVSFFDITQHGCCVLATK